MTQKILLIIEDEKILAEMYRDIFNREEIKVVSAQDAETGLALARKEKPDLILLDILLPKENGIAFLTWLKKDPEISHIKVVAFSNYDDPATKNKALELGVKEYLIKTNYTPQEIVKKIESYLEENGVSKK